MTGAGNAAGDPRMWLNERRRAGCSASSHGPAALLAPAPRSRGAEARPRARPLVPEPCSAPPGSGVRSRLEQPRPPRSRAPGAAPSDRTTGAARGGGRWDGSALPPPRWSRPALGRGCSTALALPAGPAPATRCAPPPSISERVRAAAPFLLPFYLCFLPLGFNGVADATPHRS